MFLRVNRASIRNSYRTLCARNATLSLTSFVGNANKETYERPIESRRVGDAPPPRRSRGPFSQLDLVRRFADPPARKVVAISRPVDFNPFRLERSLRETIDSRPDVVIPERACFRMAASADR